MERTNTPEYKKALTAFTVRANKLISPRYHLALPAPCGAGLIRLLPCKIPYMAFRITAWHFNARQPVTAYLRLAAFGVQLQDVFACGSFARLSSTGCFLWGCPGCYFFFSKPFCILLCLTAILSYPASFVKPFRALSFRKLH